MTPHTVTRYILALFALSSTLPAIWAMPSDGSDHGVEESHYSAPALESLGGPFTLRDTSGELFSDAELHGKFSLVFVGFMECGEACPVAIGAIRMASETLKAEGVPAQAVFIDFRAPRLDDLSGGLATGHDGHQRGRPDPAVGATGPEIRRAALKEWQSTSEGQLITLSGTRRQTNDVIRNLKVRRETNSARDKHGGHRINHTTVVYLFGPSGQIVDVFYHTTPPSEMIERVRSLAASDES